MVVYPETIILTTPGKTEITADSPTIQLIAEQVILQNNFYVDGTFKVNLKLLNKLVMQPTVVKLLNCVNDAFFEIAGPFSISVKHVDLRECVCKKKHFKKQMKRIRETFPNLVKIWDN
uniref:Recep_L_domain domain-containing protein n=1 Tax=Panagrellus redivivus TaxID=6233 RepID=A0A7E4VS90_PANRE